ncbi:hypothetical protein M426DRAFT_63789 [Hypoxylon sp. CI-4A]|nr:hypothetical protein M426DRAFT_63789 [Hypoxylon sp. CI-4A]
MADTKNPDIPSWQQAQPDKDAASETDHSQNADADATEVTLEQARKFLRDETVRDSGVEKKIEFLKSKGFDDDQIQQLLKEAEEDAQTPNIQHTSEASRQVEPVSRAVSSESDPAPIITYPEFLTTSPKPPPLITPSRLANILTISGSVWTLLYGAARFAVNPMVDNLNDARTDYYDHVGGKLEQLVEQLEGVVSEVPYKNGKPLRSRLDDFAYEDDESTFSDPTELFHRDIGTQTSPVILPEDANTPNQADKPIDAQARRLNALRASLREVKDIHTRNAENSADLNALVREIREEVDKLGAPPSLADFTSFYGGMGYGRSSEPNDEVKKTKDAIRSVKGMLLSSRSFPVTKAAR